MENKFLVSEYSELELVAINSPDSNENTGNQQSMCHQTILRAHM